jgi:uncharacterized protein (TIGR02147 family)
MKNCFYYSNYSEFLKDWITSQASSRGILSRIAEKLSCQNSHLTRVLRQEEHLTMDQAFELSEYMKLPETEALFLLKLVEYERAGSPNYKKKLHHELARLRKEHEDLDQRIKDQRINLGDSDKETIYYSNWIMSALHIIVSIPKYQSATSIAQRLRLPELFVVQCLKTLENFGLVQYRNNQWMISTGSLHLNKHSPLNAVRHSQWRQVASQNRLTQVASDGVHYTMVQSLSEKDFLSVKQLILNNLEQYRQIADPSEPEELICFSLDFFRV